MAVTKIPARDWTFEILSGAVWTEVGGLETWSPSFSQNDADTTDFASAGMQEHLIMSRGYELTVEGFFLEDVASGARDAGQAAVETLALAVGLASLGEFRVTSPGGTVYTFDASAAIGNAGGGGKDDVSKWSATLTRSGATTIT